MTTLSIVEAQAQLAELIHRLTPGQEVLITENNRPVARLTAESGLVRQPRKAGSAKGLLTIIQDDEEHLGDFTEYMP